MPSTIIYPVVSSMPWYKSTHCLPNPIATKERIRINNNVYFYIYWFAFLIIFFFRFINYDISILLLI